jgi:hypothetical protein
MKQKNNLYKKYLRKGASQDKWESFQHIDCYVLRELYFCNY